MTRIFTDGAEFGDTLFWDDSTNVSASATTPRSGAYCYSARECAKNFPALSELYFRWGIDCDYVWGTTTLFFRYNTTTIFKLIEGTGHYLEAYVGASKVATGTVMMVDNWNTIEVHLLINDSTGKIQVKVNGLLDIDYTGDTQPGSDTAVNNLYVSNGGSYAIDDLALNDTNGSFDNSWCGDGHIEILVPNADGDVNDWMGSDGDKTNNWQLVDEIPSTGDTDYVTTSGYGIQDMYNLGAFTDTNKVITRIIPAVRVKDASALGGVMKVGYKTGGVVYLGSGEAIPNVYTELLGSSARVNPSGLAWTKAELDALQIVIECE